MYKVIFLYLFLVCGGIYGKTDFHTYSLNHVSLLYGVNNTKTGFFHSAELQYEHQFSSCIRGKWLREQYKSFHFGYTGGKNGIFASYSAGIGLSPFSMAFSKRIILYSKIGLNVNYLANEKHWGARPDIGLFFLRYDRKKFIPKLMFSYNFNLIPKGENNSTLNNAYISIQAGLGIRLK